MPAAPFSCGTCDYLYDAPTGTYRRGPSGCTSNCTCGNRVHANPDNIQEALTLPSDTEAGLSHPTMKMVVRALAYRQWIKSVTLVQVEQNGQPFDIMATADNADSAVLQGVKVLVACVEKTDPGDPFAYGMLYHLK